MRSVTFRKRVSASFLFFFVLRGLCQEFAEILFDEIIFKLNIRCAFTAPKLYLQPYPPSFQEARNNDHYKTYSKRAQNSAWSFIKKARVINIEN
jgi:hypothetical protein